MAGRAAMAGQRPKNARDHFGWLITNGPLSVASSPIPVSLVAEAYLFRGDMLAENSEPGANPALRWGEAILFYSKVAEQFPTNEYAPLAWGRIGDCHFQLAAQDPARYDLAVAAYQKVVNSGASITVRSQAQFSLGTVAEHQARLRPVAEQGPLLDLAQDHYFKVLYSRNLRDGEQPDAFWMKKAGLAAAELLEGRKRPDQAVAVYRRMQAELPPLRPWLEKKLEKSAAGGTP